MSKSNGSDEYLEVPVAGAEEPLRVTYTQLANWFDENSKSLSQRRAAETMQLEIKVKCLNTGREIGPKTEHEGAMVEQTILVDMPYMDVKFYEIPKPLLGLIQKLASAHKDRRESLHMKIDGERRDLFKRAKDLNDPTKLKLTWPGQFSGLVLSVQEAMEISNNLAFDDITGDEE